MLKTLKLPSAKCFNHRYTQMNTDRFCLSYQSPETSSQKPETGQPKISNKPLKIEQGLIT